MQHFGTFKIGGGKGPGNFYEIVWLTSKEDWNFVVTWEAAVEETDSQSMRDSLEYAQIGAKRWSWLSAQGTCVTGFEDIESRTANVRKLNSASRWLSWCLTNAATSGS